MPIIEWKVIDLVGIEELDRHHKLLVQLLNNSYDKFAAGTDIEKSVIDELAEYAASHFAKEEGLMASCRYPELAAHIEEHEIFTWKMELFRNSRSEDRSVEIIWFLCSWITHHFRETDYKFANYIALQEMSSAV